MNCLCVSLIHFSQWKKLLILFSEQYRIIETFCQYRMELIALHILYCLHQMHLQNENFVFQSVSILADFGHKCILFKLAIMRRIYFHSTSEVVLFVHMTGSFKNSFDLYSSCICTVYCMKFFLMVDVDSCDISCRWISETAPWCN